MEPAFSILGVQYSFSYVLTFFLGIVVLLVFSLEKFDKPYPGNKYLAELLPSSLSPGRSYIKAFFIYFGVIVGIFATACIFFGTASGIWDVFFGEGFAKKFASPGGAVTAGSPDNEKPPPTAAAEIPLLLALVIVGLFPKYRQFGEFEAPLRRFAHRLIGVPQGLEKQTVEIAATPLSSLRNDRGAIIRLFVGSQFYQLPNWARDSLANSLSFSQLDETRAAREGGNLTEEEQENWSLLQAELEPRLRVANKWYRVRQLIGRIHPDQQGTKVFDVEAREKYERLRADIGKTNNELGKEITRIAEEQRKLSKLVATLRNVSSAGAIKISESDLQDVIESLEVLQQKRLDELVATEERIDDLLGKIHLYMAASVLLKQTQTEQFRLIDAYGLARPRLHDQTTADDILVAILLMVGLLFAFNYLVYHVLAWFSFADKDDPTITALRLGVSALIMHGGAAIVAFSWRGSQANSDQWDSSEKASTLGIRQYIGLGTIVYIAVYLGLLLWAFVAVALSAKTSAAQNPLRMILSDTDLIISYAVLSLSAVVTAVCATRYIDYAERFPLNNKSIAVLALIQSGLTAFIVLVSSQILTPDDRYFIVMSCLNGFVIGATLGASVLKLASRRRPSSRVVDPILLPSPNN